jgi:hypothetical protein
MSQLPFGTIALIAQGFLIERPMNSYGQMSNVVDFDTIGSTIQDELRSGFAFQAVNQEDDRDVFLKLLQELQHLCCRPAGAGVLG